MTELTRLGSKRPRSGPVGLGSRMPESGKSRTNDEWLLKRSIRAPWSASPRPLPAPVGPLRDLAVALGAWSPGCVRVSRGWGVSFRDGARASFVQLEGPPLLASGALGLWIGILRFATSASPPAGTLAFFELPLVASAGRRVQMHIPPHIAQRRFRGMEARRRSPSVSDRLAQGTGRHRLKTGPEFLRKRLSPPVSRSMGTGRVGRPPDGSGVDLRCTAHGPAAWTNGKGNSLTGRAYVCVVGGPVPCKRIAGSQV